ncbi:hypothetical protein EDM57_19645 [Brevibacillus gelatini]|uniref:Uncharacterized protein n=1 Tax=Brevibacillus gelatini TaxID=1655277 RepID=A0A3M8AQS7_9BACL|nr:hypothetical protein [Brevibacillus gelatini]RNB53510.1 hypothetical protein EDM57_19645 [Brevibacillus gelatini]
MLSVENIQPYFPVVVAFITATLGYFLGIRTKKFERLYVLANENLKDICSPMFHELRKIKQTEDPEKREEMLRIFFEKHTDSNSNVYKLANRFIIDSFYEMEQEFSKFLRSRSREDWRGFWYKFEGFYLMVEEEYFSNYDFIYREFGWLRSLCRGNLFLRIVQEFIKLLYTTSSFIVIVCVFLVYLTVYDYFVGTNFAPKGSIKLAVIITFLSITIWGLTLIMASHYLVMTKTKWKKGFLRKLFEKYSPKIVSFWDNWLGNQPKWIRDKITVPEMYQKQQNEGCDERPAV